MMSRAAVVRCFRVAELCRQTLLLTLKTFLGERMNLGNDAIQQFAENTAMDDSPGDHQSTSQTPHIREAKTPMQNYLILCKNIFFDIPYLYIKIFRYVSQCVWK